MNFMLQHTFMRMDIKSVIKIFEYYKSLGERTFAQLEDEHLFWQYNAESNSIAIMVNHLCGNMLSRWTDFLTTDGEKDWRNRDSEFESVITTRDEMLQRWEHGWRVLFAALESLNNDNIGSTVFIRKQAHTVPQAIDRQLAHYAYHVGQIVFVGRMLKGSEWVSLSIPKGESDTFNKNKMADGEHSGHYTDKIKK